jgi:hypothetical protein
MALNYPFMFLNSTFLSMVESGLCVVYILKSNFLMLFNLMYQMVYCSIIMYQVLILVIFELKILKLHNFVGLNVYLKNHGLLLIQSTLYMIFLSQQEISEWRT